MELVVKAKAFSKQIKDKIVFHKTNFDLEKGSVSILLGKNGTGKTTLIKSIIGAISFEGKISINGFDNHTKQAKDYYSFVPDKYTFPKKIDVTTFLTYMGFLGGLTMSKSKEKAIELLEKYKMHEFAKSLPEKMSLGEQKKILLIESLMSNPKLIIMDEPLNSLDFKTRKTIAHIIGKMSKEGTTFLISTHSPETFEKCISKILIISKQKITTQKITSTAKARKYIKESNV